MSVALADAAQRAGYWPLPLARALSAAVLAIVITFSADHSATFGLTVFGGFAILSGLVLAILGRSRIPAGLRGILVAHGIVSVVFGAFSIGLRTGGVASFFLVVSSWAAITAALELYLGLRTRRRHAASADWIAGGVLTAVLAIVFVLIPPEFAQDFTGPDGVRRVLDSAVVAVGLLGAYAAIIAVYLAIAGLSAKWGPQKATDTPDAVKGERT